MGGGYIVLFAELGWESAVCETLTFAGTFAGADVRTHQMPRR
jgi:hypothetical protein